MSDDAAPLLRLMWLASPTLPVGGFSYSEGLEAAVEAGLAGDETKAGDWLLDQLQLSPARCDLPLVAQAFDAWEAGDADRIAALNAWADQTRETAEGRQQSMQTGRSLLEWLRNGEQGNDPCLLTLAALQPAPL
jgi:urease accessory protein